MLRVVSVAGRRHQTTLAASEPSARFRSIIARRQLNHNIYKSSTPTYSISWTRRTCRWFSTHFQQYETSMHRKPKRFKLPPILTEEVIHDMITQFKKCHLLEVESAVKLLERAHSMFQNLPTLMEFQTSKDTPLTVIGDVHGQLYDVLNIFALNGFPSPTNRYLFNGDLVDRGWWGSEIFFILLAFKMIYPDSVHINAGNHEDHNCTERYGFMDEINQKYNENVYIKFMDVFGELPLASVINASTFVAHGGLPGKDVSLNEIKTLPKRSIYATLGRKKFDENTGRRIMALLWSDPDNDRDGYSRSRGIPWNAKDSADFLGHNKLDLILRSHECVDGHHSHHGGKCVTLFSAAHYCRTNRNRGAFARFEDSKEPTYKKYGPSYDPHYDGEGHRGRR